jgi:hypothetical protein
MTPEEEALRRIRVAEKTGAVALEPLKKILPSQYPVLKPVGLPDY